MSFAIRAEGLTKTYRIKAPGSGRGARIEKAALNDVSFELEPAQVLGIIGRNGAGKSTLLKILSRIIVPTRGRALVRGTVASLLEVGTGMHPEMTGRENVFLNGALLGMSRRDIAARFDEIVEYAGVWDYINTPIKRYSSGMRLRLAFAVAAYLSADIMIIDEVLAVGDAEFQAKCLGTMQQGARSGRTVLFVSHNMAAVENLCSQVAWLESGRIVQYGDSATTVKSYLQAAVGGSEASALLPDRGDPDVSICRVAASGEDGTVPQQGGDVFVDVDLEVKKPVRGLKLLVKITTLEDYPVCGVSSTDYRQEWNLDPGAYRVRVWLQSARLLPNTHKVSVFAYTRWTAEILDARPDVVTFQVLERDILGTGRPVRSDRGVTWIPTQFTLTERDSG
jgi:lipopolysaccharide transport system ATP-binding protein